ncbi:hypothetical protein ACP70R_039002 [Stipagrostis hirtigluma subsp. patula]
MSLPQIVDSSIQTVAKVSSTPSEKVYIYPQAPDVIYKHNKRKHKLLHARSTTMPCTLSTQRRVRPTQAKVMPDWSSLPPELVREIGDCLLAADDLDYYIDFRAVCQDWRSTTDDPKDGANPRFQPRNWVLLKRNEDLLTLVNVETGRFLFKNMPLLRRYLFVGATSGGLILLGESVYPHQARLLNPFTGSIVNFKVRIPTEKISAVAVTTSPMMVFISSGAIQSSIMWADQNDEYFHHFWVKYPDQFFSLTSFAGNVYLTNRQGSILSTIRDGIVKEGTHQGSTSTQTISVTTTIPSLYPTMMQSTHCRHYLVESRGELLLVTKPWWCLPRQLVVYRVDTVKNALEPVRSIGSHALFVSPIRCLSVDASKFKTIEGDCIYFVEPNLTGSNEPQFVTMFHIATGAQDLMWDLGTIRGCFHPFTLAQDFVDYCKLLQYSELGQMLFSDDDFWYDSESEEESSESDEGSSESDEGSSESDD